jgi:hypothetical protein
LFSLVSNHSQIILLLHCWHVCRDDNQIGRTQPEETSAAQLEGDRNVYAFQDNTDVAAAQNVFDNVQADDANDKSPTSSPRWHSSSHKLPTGSTGDGVGHRLPRHVRKVSKFEQDRLQERKARHKQQVAQPKVGYMSRMNCSIDFCYIWQHSTRSGM